MKKLTILFICCLIPAVFPSFSYSKEAAGYVEREFAYNVYWAGIKAGKAELEYRDTPEGFSITSRAKSAAFISIFYKVRDTAQSILYPDGYPKKYHLKISEGRYKRNRITHFERTHGNPSHKITYEDKTKDDTAVFRVEEPCHDTLSAFYAMTKRPLTVGESEYIGIFDKKKFYNTEVKVLRKEKVSVPAGEFDTIVVKPLLKSEGIFVRKGDLHIWVTDDERKIPVMIKSEVTLGSFTAKLVKAR